MTARPDRPAQPRTIARGMGLHRIPPDQLCTVAELDIEIAYDTAAVAQYALLADHHRAVAAAAAAVGAPMERELAELERLMRAIIRRPELDRLAEVRAAGQAIAREAGYYAVETPHDAVRRVLVEREQTDALLARKGGEVARTTAWRDLLAGAQPTSVVSLLIETVRLAIADARREEQLSLARAAVAEERADRRRQRLEALRARRLEIVRAEHRARVDAGLVDGAEEPGDGELAEET